MSQQPPEAQRLPELLELELSEPKCLEPTTELSPLSIIRTETALSRFPLHRIAKRGNVKIELKNQAAAVLWKVSYNSEYGQPGPTAYKLDTIFINRKLEEAGKPTPKTIKLGSLSEICRDLKLADSGSNRSCLKKALHQNASAYITAKITFKRSDKTVRLLEGGFTRYSVIFTGESLPDGRPADAVYLILNDIYQEVLNEALARPLDYDYMKALPPAAQRFYEIASYQIYAALLHKNPRAKLTYSDYCTLSTQTRYTDWDHVKKQMYKVHLPHLRSGYLAKVEYEATTDCDGGPDWNMLYTPGPNATAEFHAFKGGGNKAVQKLPKHKEPKAEVPTLPFPSEPQQPQPQRMEPSPQAAADGAAETSGAAESSSLVEELARNGLNRGDSVRFARERPGVCRRQLEFLPYVKDFKSSRGAYLRRAIEEDYGPPAAYDKARRQQEAAETSKRRRARELFEAQEKKARQSHEERCYGAYLDYLRERVGELEKAQPEAFMAFQEAEARQRAVLTDGPFANRPLNRKALEVFDREDSRLERCREYWRERGVEILTFWQWDEMLNPEAFKF